MAVFSLLKINVKTDSGDDMPNSRVSLLISLLSNTASTSSSSHVKPASEHNSGGRFLDRDDSGARSTRSLHLENVTCITHAT